MVQSDILMMHMQDTWKKLWIILTFVVLTVFPSTILSFAVIAAGVPNISDASILQPNESAVFVDHSNTPLHVVFKDEDRRMVMLNQLPDYVPQAFIAIEDERFFDRNTCIDFRALGRAVAANVVQYKSQGASTITQQLARVVFLDRSKVIQRKIREIELACRMERVYTKSQILEYYLNWISFGKNIYGIEQASQYFFGIPATQLSMPQAVVLASLPQRPTYFDPYGSHAVTQVDLNTLDFSSRKLFQWDIIPEVAIRIGLTGTGVTIHGKRIILGGRAHQVLAQMEKKEYITAEEKRKADAALLHISYAPQGRKMVATHLTFSVIDDALHMLHVDEEEFVQKGYSVRTTIDASFQKRAEELVRQHSSRISETYKATNIAVLVAERETGRILTYIGNTDYFSSGTGIRIDMIRQPRQPGSSFKPVIYTYLLEKKQMQPYSIVQDTPLRIGNDTPKNYDGTYAGNITLMTALAQSRNIPAIRAYQSLHDEEGILKFAHAIGIQTPLYTYQNATLNNPNFQFGWPLAIGSAEASLWEMVQAYHTLSNSGEFTQLSVVDSIQDRSGFVVYQPEPKSSVVASASATNTITSMLSESAARPAGFWRDTTILPGIDAAIKTGTSNVCTQRSEGRCIEIRPRDLWALGYTPSLVVGVWIGNADGSALSEKANGLEAAVPLWKDIVLAGHDIQQHEPTLFAKELAPYYRYHKRPIQYTAQSTAQDPPSWIGMSNYVQNNEHSSHE